MNKAIGKILIFFVICLLGVGKIVFDNNAKNIKRQNEIKEIVAQNNDRNAKNVKSAKNNKKESTNKNTNKKNKNTKSKNSGSGNTNNISSDNISSDTNSSRKYKIDYDHVIGGDENSSGKVTGGHTLLKGDVRIVKKIGQAAENGVYKASVEILKKDGTWQKKTSNGGVNTMFPENWDEAKVIEEINSAWENRKDYNGSDSNMWQGRSKSGVLIRGYKSPRITAYPVYEGGR